MNPSRFFIILLIIIMLLLGYKLWFSDTSANRYWRLKDQLAAIDQQNQFLQQRNAQVVAEIDDLKHGDAAVEENARNDLGLVKSDEVFYQLVP